MITYEVEPWGPFIKEVQPILPRHWEELALNKDKIPLDPMYELYEQWEAKGSLFLLVVRCERQIIGYFIGLIGPGVHYKSCMECHQDIFYVVPEFREHGIGFHMFKAVERELRNKGVNRLTVGTKSHKDASYLFEKLGYTESEKHYTYWLGP